MIDIDNLAHLARIKINPKLKEQLQKEFEEILNYFEKLKKVDINKIQEQRVENIVGLKNVLREDEPQNKPGQYSEILLKEAPEKEDGYIRVKHVFE